MQSIVAKTLPVVKAGEAVSLFKSYDPRYADGGQLRDFVYVRDCVDVVLWLLDHSNVNGIFNLGTGQAIPAANMAAAYDPATHSISYTFPGYLNCVLPDGDYRASLAPGLTDLFGNGTVGTPTFDFFFLAGDANRDRKVDVADLGILATNWQQSPRTFAQGDFDYSGKVDVNDLGILATRWQQSVAAPSAPAVGRPSSRVIDQVNL